MDLKKVNNLYYAKLRKENASLISFSEADEFHNCPAKWKIGRLDKLKGDINIYGLIGGDVHAMQEDIYEGIPYTNETLVDTFYEKAISSLTKATFPSEAIKNRYIANVVNYFQLFKKDNRIKACEVFCGFPLFKYDKSLTDIYFQGWIDCVIEDVDGNIHLCDFKTSTIYTEKEIREEKGKQLILYAVAYEHLYGKKVHSIAFDFIKYAKIQNGDDKPKTVERTKLDGYIYDKIDKAYVSVELTDEIKKETVEWLVNTYKNIQTAKRTMNFPSGRNSKTNFFCKNLCGLRKFNMC